MADISDFIKLQAGLSSAGRRVGRQAAALTRATAARIERDAKLACPVDTGFLRNSIGTTITGDGRGGIVSATVGPTADYAGYVEFGTSRQRPQPFMNPAADRHTPGWLAGIEALGGTVL